MLFMSIFIYEPEKRDEVIKRRAEKGAMIPEGMKVLGEWSDTSGGRVFRLVEMDDPKVGIAASLAWSDLGKIEIVPVMATEESIQVATKR